MNKNTKIGLAVVAGVATLTALAVGFYKKCVKPAEAEVEECNYDELPADVEPDVNSDEE